MSAARIKQIDKIKSALLKKVDIFTAKKKKLYSNMDITSAKSAEEKQLDKEIADLFSQLNTLILEKRKLVNFTTNMKSEKDKLAAKSVEQLKAAAKRLGGKLVTPDGKAKTKQQLINTIVMKNRLAGKSMGAKQTGTTNKLVDIKRKAKAPGKRTSAKGKVYTETRKNRTDKPGTMLGQKIQDYRAIENVRIFEAIFLGPTNVSGSRVKINDYRFNESKTIPFGYKTNDEGQTAAEYLNTLGIKIVAKGESPKGTLLFTKNFEKSIKDKA